MSPHPTQRDWSRREILAAGCALAGSLGVGRAARAEHDQAGNLAGPFGPFKMGLQSYSLRGLAKDGRPDLSKALAATKALGLHYWESYPAHVPMDADSQTLGSLRQQVADAGVTLAGYGVVHFGRDDDANRRIFEFAKSLGLEYLSADPDPACFDGLDKLVETFGIAVGIHNHGPGHRYDTIEKIAKAIENHNPKIGCCIDTGHFLRSRVDPVDAVAAFGKRVYGVHLKDVKNAQTFTILGMGDLRTVELLRALAGAKYSYCLAIEYEEKPEDPVDDIKACVTAAASAIAAAVKV
jgi:sugar phosphate isomerase/epimerase